MIFFTKTLLLSLMLSLTVNKLAFAEEEKFLCITTVTSGLVFENGTWVATEFKGGSKYLISVNNGKLTSAKLFGAPKHHSMNKCQSISKSSSFCSDNFDRFRFQTSTKRFVLTKTEGYTNEYEEAGVKLLPTSFTPNISIGMCDSI